MALLGYLRHSASNGFYCAVPAGASAEALLGALGQALQLEAPPATADGLVAALAQRAPAELALDFEDLPAQDGVEVVLRLIDELPDEVALLIACRARTAFQVGRFVSQGSAVLCDAERLAFDAAGIRHVAETLNVPFTHADVLRMLEATDGWPQVVSGALRKAAEDSVSLSQAFEHWRMRHGHLFNEFIAAALTHVSEQEADLVLKLMSGSHLDDRVQLQSLEEQGLFVVHTPDGYRPLRALSRSRLYDRYGRRVQSATPMQVRLFGWFLAEIDRQPIEWVRRRDRQIFKYIALQPNGSVSRAEVGQVFWPGAERHLVAQSLRTVCSNIRKAIANIVGFKQVEAYFRAGDELAIDLDNVIIDVNRFVSHANDADEQYERGEMRAAYAHYRSAARVYRGDLLIGDAHEPWVGTLDTILKQRHAAIQDRINEIVAAFDGQQPDQEANLRLA
ncbi:MAG TPA: BTAD domain-containing putative transcriptional regulator [Candidatus Binatia bacterium]|nr:BTAD domain-containing putative transcriptional regulator [Candidatus Binatia bacterium]